MRRIELSIDDINAINQTLVEIDFPSGFNNAITNFKKVKKPLYKDSRMRHTFNAKKLIKLLKGAEFVIVSAGTSSVGNIKFCFQPIVKVDNEYYEVTDKVLTSYKLTEPVHPINGIPRE